MTDQPTPTPDDDSAKRAIDLIRAESEDRVLPWSYAETTVRAAYAPLIASVRELVGEILHIQSYGRVPTSLSEKVLLQQIADAIEVVRKERAWHAQIECDKRWLLDQEKQSKATEQSLQRQLAAADAEKQSAVAMYDAASQERRQLRAENEPVECPCCHHSTKHGLGKGEWMYVCEEADCHCRAEFRNDALKAIEEAVRWATNDHHCKSPLGNPTREEAMAEIDRLLGEQAITANVIQAQQEQIRKLTLSGPIGPEVREKIANELADWLGGGMFEGQIRMPIDEADCIIAILAGEQERR